MAETSLSFSGARPGTSHLQKGARIFALAAGALLVVKLAPSDPDRLEDVTSHIVKVDRIAPFPGLTGEAARSQTTVVLGTATASGGGLSFDSYAGDAKTILQWMQKHQQLPDLTTLQDAA